MKPKIICHIMSSVDGRLLNERWTQPFDGTPASDLLQVYAAIGRELGTDAWMFGKNTLRAAFPYKWGIDGHAVSSDSPIVFVGERRSERMFIAADPEADIFFTSSSLRGDNILVIVGRSNGGVSCPSAREADFLRHRRRCDRPAGRSRSCRT